MENFICPDCGGKIDANSRKPVDTVGTGMTELAIGTAYARIMHFFYIFYMICALIGFTAYSFKLDTLLYIITVVPVSVFLIQSFLRTTTFPSGVLFLPLGAAAGYLYFKTIQGSCLGIHFVFFLRHLIRDIFFRLISKLINLK